MGIVDAAERVIPKPILIGPPQRGGTLVARYFTPRSCHNAFAITGAVGLATACATPGTIASRLLGASNRPAAVTIEHPSGTLDLRLETPPGGGEPTVFVLRTARRLFEGAVFARVPRNLPAAEAA
jgi:2-methylaconitate cis-trans-isomerase PrpF